MIFSSTSMKPNPTRVLIAGADTKIGSLVFQKLQNRRQFYPIGLVKSKSGENELRKLGAESNQIQNIDYTNKANIIGKFIDIDKCVICVSSKSKKRIRYRIKNFFLSLIGKKVEPLAKDLKYSRNETPYYIDYLAQKNIIDESIRTGVKHIVLLGSMGGYKGSKINEIGRGNSKPKDEYEDLKQGNVLKWKRATERYLMKRCQFTIIHAGTLTDDTSMKREIIWDTDDALLRTNFKKICREDVAEVIVQSLIWKEAMGRSIDIASKPIDETNNSMNNDKDSEFLNGYSSSSSSNAMNDFVMYSKDWWLRFWARPGNCVYPADFDDLKFK